MSKTQDTQDTQDTQNTKRSTTTTLNVIGTLYSIEYGKLIIDVHENAELTSAIAMMNYKDKNLPFTEDYLKVGIPKKQYKTYTNKLEIGEVFCFRVRLIDYSFTNDNDELIEGVSAKLCGFLRM